MSATEPTPLEIALDHIRSRGWSIVPIKFREKGPKIPGWPDLRITAEQAPDYFNGARMNIGVLLGEASGGLRDVDNDAIEACEVSGYFLPGPTAIFGRSGKRSSHWLYTVEDVPPDLPSTLNFDDPAADREKGEKARIIELRLGGAKAAQTVLPGSWHADTGQRIVWEVDKQPLRIPFAELRTCVRCTAAAALLRRHWPPTGGPRHDTALALGAMLRRAGWDIPRIKIFVEAAAGPRTDHPATAADSARKVDTGGKAYGVPKLQEHLDARVVKAVVQWLGLHERASMEEDGSSTEARKEQGNQASAGSGAGDKGADPHADPHAVAVALDDFHALMPQGAFIYVPSREIWPAVSVNGRLAPVQVGLNDAGQAVKVKASVWLAKHRPVEQMTWQPGGDEVIRDRLVAEGGFVARPGARVFNLYRAPTVEPGDPDEAWRWFEHVRCLYPDEAEHIFTWLAHRVQRPGEKVNHAVVFGGAPGIGKDSILTPVAEAIGPWNSRRRVTTSMMLGKFTGFLKSVVLRISEARDLGEFSRYDFYERLKTVLATPPETLVVNEKNLKEYRIPNVTGVVITTNYREDGIFLPPDDRRHFVVWSELAEENFAPGYFVEFHDWLRREGNRHVAAFLARRDLSGFDPKAPPPKTAAFWAIADTNRSFTEVGIADRLDALRDKNGGKWQPAITIEDLAKGPDEKLEEALRDPKNRRHIPAELERLGYLRFNNPSAKDRLWKISGKRQAVYVRRELTHDQRYKAVLNHPGRQDEVR